TLTIVLAVFVMASPLVNTTAHAQDNTIKDSEENCKDNQTQKLGKKKRRRPGGANRDCNIKQVVIDPETGDATVVVVNEQKKPRNYVPQTFSAIPRPNSSQFKEMIPIPDRWRIVDALGYNDRWYDPYNRNVLKADKPVYGDDWFFNLSVISDTVYEDREVATPVGLQSSNNSGDLDVFGNYQQSLLNENLAIEFVYYKGDTTFKPPEYEFRFIPVFNYNRTRIKEILGLNVDPERGQTRTENHVGIQALFVDKHLRDVSANYDFDSIRFGIQPFSSDFRGFLFQDSPFGVRLFGTRNNNKYQYNLAVFRRMEKDTNSGLNDAGISLRDDDLFIANIYLQDKPTLGFFSQFTIIHNRNRENDLFFDNNGFLARPASFGTERPREYDVTYLGYNGDGHFGRLNLTTSAYYAYGDESHGVFTEESADIRAYFLAAEASIDFDWIRLSASLLYGSGDDDPFDNRSEGFDAIFENPQFAGADTSYWIRQANPLIGGGKVALSARNGILNSLRSSKEHGQSNFTNPGVGLLGVGMDMELLPELSFSMNANYLQFNTTEVLEVARQQANIDKDIGLDLSAAVIWRPLNSQNVVLRLSYARLFAGDGFEQLFGKGDPDSLLLNIILTY
ncbi:MAG: hypothetical protein JKX98_06890, partial [Alcanivoracaceae bacterium]|nr:hypothetical protein [Alcanivoracaceae bacterium]